MNPIIKNLEAEYTTRELPDMNPGDTVRVFVKIVEGNKERIQAYEGTIIAEHGSGINKTITVRKVFQGVGVERVFLVHSPRIDKITVSRFFQIVIGGICSHQADTSSLRFCHVLVLTLPQVFVLTLPQML